MFHRISVGWCNVRWVLRGLCTLPDVGGYRLTWKRLFNFCLSRYESHRGRTVLRSHPMKLVVEPTNVCNLRCPYCHTGAGRRARPAGMLRLDRYRQLLDEIGDYLFEIEVFNWGEPLLHPELVELIREATARGIGTKVNTNFSVRFTAEDAARLIEAGLTALVVSVDGATQEVYQRYRVEGDLDTVIRNCRLLTETKKRLASRTPRMSLQFLAFPFNAHEGTAVERLAAELEMGFLPFKGAVPDRQGRPGDEWAWWMTPQPGSCLFLWESPVLTSDGSIAPCRGVFLRGDDMGRFDAQPEQEGNTFAEIWNNQRYQSARRFFTQRDGSPDEQRLVCFDCPTTHCAERWREHRASGGNLESFDPGHNTNDVWNYFWVRGRNGVPAPGRSEGRPDPFGSIALPRATEPSPQMRRNPSTGSG